MALKKAVPCSHIQVCSPARTGGSCVLPSGSDVFIRWLVTKVLGLRGLPSAVHEKWTQSRAPHLSIVRASNRPANSTKPQPCQAGDRARGDGSRLA